MKIQSLAIMFIILILPISLVLATYTQSRVETISLQTEYDSKLKNATYDAIKAYQLNSVNSGTSDYVNSKMRDIKASVNTFLSSISNNFSSVGYTKETIQNYVPALVYTMYDGYYIYSPYTNTWDEQTKETFQDNSKSTYSNEQKLYGLKPYVYYSSRYKGTSTKGSYDIIITYSLDNYISIQGTVANGVPISKYGYLISGVNVNNNVVTYRGVTIEPEDFLRETVYVNGKECTNLPYAKINGIKYYKDVSGTATGKSNQVFSIVNGKSINQNDTIFNAKDNSAVNYYKEAAKLQEFIQTYLSDVKINNAVDLNGNAYNTKSSDYPYQTSEQNLFDYGYADGIESSGSTFNTHRIDVIKYSIERNLSIAIENFNKYSNISTNFKMPKLKAIDWDKITDNISMISFLQGINIGGKVYNGYSIVTNTKNQDVVSENSIYISTTDSSGITYHRATAAELTENGVTPNLGIFNIDLERRTAEDTNGVTKYYFPKYGKLSYDSIVTQNKVDTADVNSYFSRTKINADNKIKSLAKVYYTALARERYGTYREKLKIDEVNPDAVTIKQTVNGNTLTGWTNQNAIRLDMTSNDNLKAIEYLYSTDKNSWSTATKVDNGNGAYLIVTEKPTNNTKGEYYIKVVDINGNESEIKTVQIKIDRSVPKIDAVQGSNIAANTATIKVSAHDDGGSGLASYCITKDTTNANASWQPIYNQNGTITQDIKENGRYYVWVKDAAGNISSRAQCDVTNLVPAITKIELKNVLVKSGAEITIRPEGNYNYKSIEYKTSDSNIAQLTSSNGQILIKVLGKTPGTATVQCIMTNYNGTQVTQSCKIKVVNAAVSPNSGSYMLSSSQKTARFSTNITVKGPVTKLKYKLSTSNTQAPTEWNDYGNVSGGSITNTVSSAGKYYLWTRLEDENGNYVTYVSDAYNVEATAIIITPNRKGWTNQDISYEISYPSQTNTTTRKAGYGTTLSNAMNSITTTNTVIATANGYIYASATDQGGNTVSASFQVSNIDKTPPTIKSIRPNTTSSTTESINLREIATDAGSGVVEYRMTSSTGASESALYNPNSLPYKDYTARKNGTYYFYVRDLAGNTSTASFTVSNIWCYFYDGAKNIIPGNVWASKELGDGWYGYSGQSFNLYGGGNKAIVFQNRITNRGFTKCYITVATTYKNYNSADRYGYNTSDVFFTNNVVGLSYYPGAGQPNFAMRYFTNWTDSNKTVSVPRQTFVVDIGSSQGADFYVGLHNCDNLMYVYNISFN